jgi:hypothetical protein
MIIFLFLEAFRVAHHVAIDTIAVVAAKVIRLPWRAEVDMGAQPIHSLRRHLFITYAAEYAERLPSLPS